MKKIPFRRINFETLSKRIPDRLKKPIRTVLLTAGAIIGVYAIVAGLGAYMIYGKNAENAYTAFVERVFPYPAAFVNGQAIPLSRFRLEVEARMNYAQKHGIESSREETERFVSEQLVNRSLYAQAVRENKISISEDDIDAKMKEIYDQVGGEDDLRAFLRENYGENIGISQFRLWIRESLVEAAVRRQLLESSHVRHILVAIPGGATDAQIEAAKAKAVDIRAKVTAVDQFAEAAKQYSEDTASRDNGGDLEIAVRGDDAPVVSKDFENAIFTQEIGTISDPIRSQYGWHIVTVEERSGNIKKSMKAYTEELRSSGVKILIGK